MDANLIAILVKNVLIPEVLAIIRAHRNAAGSDPTDAQVIAALNLDAERVKATGQAFLDATRQ